MEMIKQPYTTLWINGAELSLPQLAGLCTNKLTNNDIADWEKAIYRFLQEWISPAPFIEVKTSGSTGTPKQLRILKVNMIQSALMTGSFFSLKPGDKTLLCLPAEYIAGKMMIVRSFVLGLKLFTVAPSGTPLDSIEERLDFSAMTPLQVHRILSVPDGSKKLENISKLIIGGAEIHPDLLQKTSSLTNEIWQTYGMTETITHVAVRKLNYPGKMENYRALRDVSFILDERNCLLIKAPHLAKGMVTTNDLVELKSKTEFEYLGRYDNIINSGGIKMVPEVIEAKLRRYIHPRFVIAGMPDVVLGQKIALIIEGSRQQDFKLKIVAQKAGLSGYEFPRQVLYLKSFPQTENGKISRKELIQIVRESSEDTDK
jgi:O-succinylbenzoic acid--CoA ligase